MKTRFFLCLAAMTLLSLTSDKEIVDYLNVKQLTFNDQVYHLKWSAKNGNYYIQEYLADNDSLPAFSEMVSLFVLNEKTKIEEAVALKIAELKEAKKTDPICNFAVTQTDFDKTMMVDFLRSESEGDLLKIVEFSSYRYKQISIGKNKSAILVFAFSKRAYGSQITPFLNTLREKRLELINHIFKTEMPEISLAN